MLGPYPILATILAAVLLYHFQSSHISSFTALSIGSVLLYSLYYSRFSTYFYKYIPPHPGVVHRGRTPPFYPNGWYVICRSSELKPFQVQPVKISGYNLVLFRGKTEAFALHAFCPHSGAHLGIGGSVKYETCIQCPFHGWVFDGKTGSYVVGENLLQRKVSFFCYHDEIGEVKMSPEEVLKKTGEGPAKLRKFLLKEMNGFVYVWLHADPLIAPNYEPLNVQDTIERLPYKGVSINKVFCHCQDIPENGGDIRHFVFIHNYFLPFSQFFSAKWEAKWLRGDDPELKLKMKHNLPWVNERKQQLFAKYLNSENSSSIGIMNLDNFVQIGSLKPFFFFNATIFQVGPGLVYLFLLSPFYEALFFQYTTILEKFEHDVYHELYASTYLPYWFSSLMLRLEAQQVTNDTFIWNYKEFASSPTYNLDSEADLTILQWRKWYSQFYDGCAIREKQEKSLNW